MGSTIGYYMMSLKQRNIVLTAAVSLSIVLGGLGCSSSTTGTSAERPKAVDMYVAGVDAYKAGNMEVAKTRLELAVAANPDLRMAHSLLGDIYRAEGNYAAAREQYEATTRLDPYTASNHYRLGLTYQFLQMFKESTACYLRALELHPKDWKSTMNLGLAYLALDQYPDAIKYADAATRMAPKEAEAWSNLGVVYDSHLQFGQAEQAYRKALELGANNITTMLNLVSNLLNQNKPGEAAAVMQQVVNKDRRAITLTRYGNTLVAGRKFDDAIAQFDEALKLDARFVPALNEKGIAYIRIFEERELELNDAPRLKALDAWKQSLALKSDQPRVQQWLKKWTEQRLFDK